MRAFVIITFILWSFSCYSQNCSCKKKFQFIKHEIETNYAGYSHKVNAKTKDGYKNLTKAFEKKADSTNNAAYCLQLLQEWLRFFKDGHLQVYSAIKPNLNDTDAIKERIRRCEQIELSTLKLNDLENSQKWEEGVYTMSDSSYKIAIVRSKTGYRDFAGVIISSKYDWWKPGQVKLELKKQNDNLYDAILYLRDHSPMLRRYYFNGASFDGGSWNKLGKDQPKRGAMDTDNFNAIQVKKLSDSTMYIQIGTFALSNYKAIDSIFKAYDKLLKSLPFLIIDLRKNGGGADMSYGPILPYLYTTPIMGIGNDIYATKDNVQRFLEYANDPDMPEIRKKNIVAFAEEMKRNLGTFINHASDDTIYYEKVEPYPRKVVVLIDNNCASTTEEFLLAARQSKKVTLLGQPTFGELDYSNMLKADIPCDDLEFHYSSTISRRIKMGLGIDGIGIKPEIQLPYNLNWVKAAQEYLEK